MVKYPMKLIPVPKEILWGGSRLKREFGKSAPFDAIAESWELTARDDGDNTVENGVYAGLTLSALTNRYGEKLLGTDCCGITRFPLLIKLIDAAEKLSVQVHPDDAYALKHENELGKTELWYIIDADEGASLVYGLRRDSSPAAFATAVENGAVEPMLHYTSVKKGDVFYIPAGQVHAIGGGILIAEIQQSSNVTYRVFDYNRRQADGSLRALHREKALDVVRFRTDEAIDALRFARRPREKGLLCASQYFTVRRAEVTSTLRLSVTAARFLSLLVLDADRARLQHGDASYAIAKGDSWLLPADLGEITLYGAAELLITSV